MRNYTTALRYKHILTYLQDHTVQETAIHFGMARSSVYTIMKGSNEISERDQHILSLLRTGNSIPEIITKTHVSRQTIHRLAKKNNIPLKSYEEECTERDQAILALVQQGKTVREVALSLGFTSQIVYRIINKYKVPYEKERNFPPDIKAKIPAMQVYLHAHSIAETALEFHVPYRAVLAIGRSMNIPLIYDRKVTATDKGQFRIAESTQQIIEDLQKGIMSQKAVAIKYGKSKQRINQIYNEYVRPTFQVYYVNGEKHYLFQCDVCGKDFSAKRMHTLYCSPECREEKIKERRIEKENKKDFLCKWCNKPSKSTSRTQFCSGACYNAWHNDYCKKLQKRRKSEKRENTKTDTL